jgi:serine/threonine-protein kinase
MVDTTRRADVQSPDSAAHTQDLAFDATIAADVSATPSIDLRATLGAERRTTVLPRVEIDGDDVRLVPTSRPRYVEQRLLGEGGVGEVFEARDEDIQRSVAIKRLLPESASAADLARFVEEIRTVGSLEHPNIVPVHDVGVDEAGRFYLVMKRIEGETLEHIIDKLRAGDRSYHARYGFERRLEIFVGLLEALNYAHASGYLHRDIKPANVMVGAFGEVVVMDWGLAKPFRDGAARLPEGLGHTYSSTKQVGKSRLFETQRGAVMGTPMYMSPEQARGEELDVRSDIYSACLTLYELLTLRHPLDGKATLAEVLAGAANEDVTNAFLLPKHAHQPPVPADMAWFVMRGLRKDREQRYANVAAMLDRLGKRREGVVPIECPVTLAQRVSAVLTKGIVRHPLAYSLSFVTLVLGGLAGIVVLLIGALS